MIVNPEERSSKLASYRSTLASYVNKIVSPIQLRVSEAGGGPLYTFVVVGIYVVKRVDRVDTVVVVVVASSVVVVATVEVGFAVVVVLEFAVVVVVEFVVVVVVGFVVVRVVVVVGES